jgi:transposase
MNDQQKSDSFSTNSLKSENAVLERNIAERDSIILKLTTDLAAAKFQNEQLRRMIFGSKRERFESVLDWQQLALEFEPKALEIEEAVKHNKGELLAPET